jgi:hypothetical protein
MNLPELQREKKGINDDDTSKEQSAYSHPSFNLGEANNHIWMT